ncbi:MAG: hypothetical protein ISS52_05590 [Dehalococcoidia bacterium]|nr:hypothetical protein [Dehalococcoidia bacterium]
MLEKVAHYFRVTHMVASYWARGKNAMDKDKREKLDLLVAEWRRRRGVEPKETKKKGGITSNRSSHTRLQFSY